MWGGALLCGPTLRCGGIVVGVWEAPWRCSTNCKGPGEPSANLAMAKLSRLCSQLSTMIVKFTTSVLQ